MPGNSVSRSRETVREGVSEPLVLDEERTAWLTTLYQANVGAVLKTCRRLLRDPEDAADAAQEVFLRAAASLHTAPDGKEASAWLATVAKNYCLDILRRRRRFQSALTTLGAGVAVIESESEVVDRHLAQAVLDQLAVRDRRALWESHVEERPVGEIAERLGLNYLATAQLLHRARRRAALVAAELVALLALIRLGVRRARMQMQNVAQPVAAVVALPAVMAVLVTITPPPSTYTAVAQTPPHSAQRAAANPRPTVPPATNPNTGLPPPAPSATAAATQQSVIPPVTVATRPSPSRTPVVSLPKPVGNPVSKPAGPPWKKGHHKLGDHGHGHSAS